MTSGDTGIKKVSPRILRVTRRTFIFSLDVEDRHYVFMLSRRGKKGGIYFDLFSVTGETVTHLLAGINVENAEEALNSCDDLFIKTNSSSIAELLRTAVEKWKEEYMARFILSLIRGEPLRRPPNADRSADLTSEGAGGHAIKNRLHVVSIDMPIHRTLLVDSPSFSGGHDTVKPILVSVNSFYGIVEHIGRVFGEEVSELLEVVSTVALSLKLPSISPDLRPLWLLIVGEPGALKSSILKFLEDSNNVFFIEQVTPAGILPARDEVPPLLPYMNGKIIVFPTMSLIASQDVRQARQLFAFFEAIYDGRLFRKTGLSGLKGGRVDTVVIGALTNEVYEKFSDVMIEYGSRWLVFDHTLPKDRFVDIYNKLREYDVKHLRYLASRLFDEMLSEFNPNVVNSYAIPRELEEDIRILAELMSKLRVSYHIRKVYDESGKPSGEEVEITQTDYPLRAYDQLKKFVIINSVMRGWRRVVGLPEVDVHAMRLATKIAISSTTFSFMKLMRCLSGMIRTIMDNRGILPDRSTLSRECGIPRTTLSRRLMILESLDIVECHESVDIGRYYVLKDRYLTVLAKYLG